MRNKLWTSISHAKDCPQSKSEVFFDQTFVGFPTKPVSIFLLSFQFSFFILTGSPICLVGNSA